MRIDSCSHHLKHPFSFGKSALKLNVRQKLASLAGLLLLPLGIVPGLIAFYAIAYSFKAEILKNNLPLDRNLPDATVKTGSAAKARFSDLLSASSSTKPATPSDFDPSQTFSLLKVTQDPTEIKKLMAKIPLPAIGLLHKDQTEMFDLLFEKALAIEERDYIKTCLGCLNRQELDQVLKKKTY